MAELSPMMRQYLDIKDKHKDEIVFFRLGDFYEMFYEDAILASKELELTLTGKECGTETRAPMCGVPFHSSEAYIARLISKGYKVAICEQVEEPSKAKGIVKRDVIRVVTPGTVIENSMLEDDKNNFICSVYITSDKAGVCFADVSTGEIKLTMLNSNNLSNGIISELCRFSPSEILFNSEILKYKAITNYIKTNMNTSVELLGDEEFSEVSETLSEQFGDNFEKEIGFTKGDMPSFALSALVKYLRSTQKKGVQRLKSVQNYDETQYMNLSPVTRANLELCETMRGREKKGTLLWVLDKTKTAMGKRLLRRYIEQPLVDYKEINARLDAVEELVKSSMTRGDIEEELAGIFDIERLLTRATYGSANPKEIYSLATTLDKIPYIKKYCQSFKSNMLCNILGNMDDLQDVKDMIFDRVHQDAPVLMKDGGIIRDGYSAEVDELRDIMHGGKGFLTELELKLKEETGIPKLKIGYNRVFGYYIEITRLHSDKVPEHFIRKQTLANAERYITQELKELESKILGASERLAILERELFASLLEDISKEIVRIQKSANAIAQLDVICNFASVAVKNNYTKPVVDNGDVISIKQGRHPVVEKVLNGSLFVPNDIALNCDDEKMLIITGPNMAGKSTYMRQNAVIVLMAQIGCYVPASECKIGVVDSIFTRVGASDDLSAGQSTFMVEMTEVAQIIENATAKSLVILDEIGRGTSTFDGMSIARAVVEYIVDNIGCKTLFATHYHELTVMEDEIVGIKNYSIAVKKRGDDITFLRRIIRGAADDSYGIEVSKLAGLPDTIITRAKDVLKMLEKSSPDINNVQQLGFDNFEKFEIEKPNEDIVKKLREIDIDTLTPLEALSVLNDLKKSI